MLRRVLGRLAVRALAQQLGELLGAVLQGELELPLGELLALGRVGGAGGGGVQLLAGDVADQLAVGHHHDPVAGGQELGELGGDDDDRLALARELADQRHDLRLAADVDARGRLVEHDHARLGGQPLGDDDLLRVAAGEGADRAVGGGGLDPQPLDLLLGEAACALSARTQEYG